MNGKPISPAARGIHNDEESGNMAKSKIVQLRFLALMTTLCIVAGNGLWGWGSKPHAVITRAALGTLPKWEQDIWKYFILKIIEEYCLIPDYCENQV